MLSEEEHLQVSGREMGELEAEFSFAADNPPTAYSSSGPLQIDIGRLRAIAESPLLGIGGDIGGYNRHRYEEQIEEAEVWNDLVRFGYIVRDESGRLRSGVSLMPDVAESMRNEHFAQAFDTALRQRSQELTTQQTLGRILNVVLLILDLLTLRAGVARGTARPTIFRSLSRRLAERLARVLTLLRRSSLREIAQRLVTTLRTQGRRIVVNIGGEASPSDVARWGETAQHAINLNPLTAARPQSIPNLVRGDAARIGELFDAGQVDEIISTRLPPNTLEWQRIVPNAHRVLRPGGRITINFQGVGEDAAIIVREMERAGFREIENLADAVVTAVKR